MASLPKTLISEEEYLRLEEQSDVKHEYYGGQIFDMSGGTLRHSLITAKTITAFNNALRGSKCNAYDANLRIRIPGPSRTKRSGQTSFYAYPDLCVICGEPRFAPRRQDTIENPVVIVEVLSPSTESHDRNFKLDQYRTLLSLDTYLILAQSEPRAYIYRARLKGKWEYEDVQGLKASVEIPAIKVKLAMRDLYENVQF